jgi:hypothetical protein
MKKLTTTFLISLTLLTFSNIAFGGFFGDIFNDIFGELDKGHWNEKRGEVNNVRCKVEYTQLDLATGLEKNVEYIVQYALIEIDDEDNVMYLSAQDITDKINIWLNESKNNFITDMTIINCKERIFYINQTNMWSSENRWGEYKGCADEYNVELINWLERPNQWGYNVHKTRLIKDYEDGCKNHYSNFKQ